MYDDSYHEWKVVLLKLIKNSSGLHFTFHSYLLFIFHIFIKTSSVTEKKYFSGNSETPWCILSQYLRFNKFLIVDNSYLSFTKYSTKNINLVSHLLNENCNFKSWKTSKNKYHLDNKFCYQWIQLIHAIY